MPRRHCGVGCPHGDRNSGAETELRGRTGQQVSAGASRACKRRQQARVQAEALHDLARPAIPGHVVEQGHRGVRRLRARPARQAQPQPVLRREGVAGVPQDRRFVAFEPQQRWPGHPGRGRVGQSQKQLVREFREGMRFLAASRVGPKDRRTQGYRLAVAQDHTVRLSGQADTHDTAGVSAAAFADGGSGLLPPVSGIRLGPARGRRLQAVCPRCVTDGPAAVVDQQRLDRAGP